MVRAGFSGRVSLLHENRFLLCIGLSWGIALPASAQSGAGSVTLAKAASTGVDGVTVTPPEFPGTINHPRKGFRDYQPADYGLMRRTSIPWNAIEVGTDRLRGPNHRAYEQNYADQGLTDRGSECQAGPLRLAGLERNGRAAARARRSTHLRLRPSGLSRAAAAMGGQARRGLGQRSAHSCRAGGPDRLLGRAPHAGTQGQATATAHRSLPKGVQTQTGAGPASQAGVHACGIWGLLRHLRHVGSLASHEGRGAVSLGWRARCAGRRVRRFNPP